MKQRLLFYILLLIISIVSTRAQTISFSGTVYDDGTENPTSGTFTNLIGNIPLYAIVSTLPAYYDSYSYKVIASTPVAPDGTYSFSSVPANVRVSLATEMGVLGAEAPSSILPNAIRAGASDYHYQRDFGLDYLFYSGIKDLAKVDFRFNRLPTANSVMASERLNPNDSTTLMTVPTLSGSDPEDGLYDGIDNTSTIAITSFPNNATLFYNNKPITFADIQINYNCVPGCSYYYIKNYDPSKFTVQPNPGTIVVTFTYRIADAAGRWSSSAATVTIPFITPTPNYDYGDIPIALENTSSPAKHRIVNGLHIGQLIDHEDSPFNSPNADGDDSNNTNDEDGFLFNNNTIPSLSSVSSSYSVTISLLNSLSQTATLSGWIDFNSNNVFEDNERAQTSVTSSPINQNVVLFWSNLTAISIGSLGFRLRLASDASEVDTPYSLATSGEVEDHLITVPPRISGSVFNDGNGLSDNIVNGRPWQNLFSIHINRIAFSRDTYEAYLTQVAPDGTFSFDAPIGKYNLILRIDNNISNYVSFTKSAKVVGAHVGAGSGNELVLDPNDIYYSDYNYLPITVTNLNLTNVNFGIDLRPVSNDVTTPSQTNPLSNNQVQVPVLTGSDSEDGIYNGSDGTNTIQIFFNYRNVDQGYPYHSDHSWGTLYYNSIPVADGQIISNYNPKELTVDPSDGNVTVEFYYKEVDAAGIVSFNAAKVSMPFSDTVSQIDFGDAPDSYGTSIRYDKSTNAFFNGARHTVLDGLRLGTLIDAEADGSVSNDADADNTTGLNDEDGIASFPVIPGGLIPQTITSYSIAVNATNTTLRVAYLSGWIDWNTNGLFDTGEIAQTNVPTGTNGPVTLTWGNQLLNGPGGLTKTYARFRLSTDQSAVNSPLGDAPDGEVEDYQVPFATALPVDLIRFEGRWIEGIGNQLNWSTAWERNNNRFEIQSSRDAKSFETIGRMVGQGTTTGPQNYTFVDPQSLYTLTYYQLKQIDTNDEFAYSPIIAVRRGDDSANQHLVVYPNPTTDLLQLQLTSQPSITSATVYAASGQSVLYLPKTTSTINVKSLPSGVYILEVKTASGQVLSQRFIKQ